jgi:predicted acyl esterase
VLSLATAALLIAPLYQFTVRHEWLTMPDGVRLAVTVWRPVPRQPSERFPVLLELLPYRKDDSFYQRDYPLYSYFVQRGYIMAKVDVRGTGGSEGRRPPREYSDEELDDAVALIAQLARMRGASGAVGMWGISWGGFNALQVAMRRPPALRAILALHASDDLFHDDVHYIDGVLHVDPYALEIDHENGLHATPDYPLDSAYFANRFDAEPWIFTYLRQDKDGEFWRRNSLRFHPKQLTIPVYLIGGLLDGYRDAVPRLLASLRGPVKAEIGPWEHDWPDNGLPGPNYEWRARAVRWWDHWLKQRDTGLLAEPRLLLFVRDPHPPSDTVTTIPGRWQFVDWPIAGTRQLTLHPASGGRLVKSPTTAGTDSLHYVADAGSAAGDWWGDRTGDMGQDDAASLIYDAGPLDHPMVVAGFPQVELTVTASAPLANWTVRLEDVSPTGAVALVTGAAANGTQLESRLKPRRLTPGESQRLALDLHFTTWTFRPGHRIRLAISNAQFPMLWPTPFPMVTTVGTGADAALRLPLMPAAGGAEPVLPPPEPRVEASDAASLDSAPPSGRRVVHDSATGVTTYELRTGDAYRIGDRRVDELEVETWDVRPSRPAEAGFVGEEMHRIRVRQRELELRTRMEVRSDVERLHVRFERTILENGARVRRRVWTDSLPRTWH